MKIREDLAQAQQRAWDRLGRPGSWLDAATRIAVAEETRHASGCRLCARRKPSRYRPREAHHSDAWVPTLAWGKAGPSEADLVRGAVSNIRRALTLVPDEARSFFDLAVHQYLSGQQMFDFSKEYRAITHAQIELVAARVSALNRCTY